MRHLADEDEVTLSQRYTWEQFRELVKAEKVIPVIEEAPTGLFLVLLVNDNAAYTCD